MNNSELSPNTVNKSLSLVKLPAIFTLIAVLSFVIFDIIAYNTNVISYPSFYKTEALYIVSSGVFHNLLNYSIWYFLLAMVMFSAQKMYQLTISNILKVCAIGVIYGGLSLFTMGNRIIYPLLRELFYFSYYDISIILSVCSPILQILSLLILIVIIILVTSFGKGQRQGYEMPRGNHRILFASAFSGLFTLPIMVLFFYVIYVPSSFAILEYFARQYSPLSTTTTVLISLLPAVITLLAVAINFFIIFFSVKNCFKRELTCLPLKLLFKAVAWTYLYILGFIIIYNVMLYFIHRIFFNLLDQTVMILILGILMLCFQLGIIAVTVICSRRSVRKYFGENSTLIFPVE